MSNQNLSSADKALDGNQPPDFEELTRQREKVFGILLEKLKPWLFEFGNWIFGGLIAFNLLIVAPLIALGPVHTAILVAIAIFACALPLNVSGLLTLKLIKDMTGVAIEDVMQEAFKDIRPANAEAHLATTEERKAIYKQRTDSALRYSFRLTLLSGALTLLGMMAALWYIAWWVTALFLIMVIVSSAMTLTVISRLMRPPSEARKT